MVQNILKYQCPACGGPVHFDVDTQMMICDYCETKYPEDFFTQTEESTDASTAEAPASTESIDWNIEGVVKNQKVMEDQAGFICSSCAAEIVSDGNTAATECIYCGNPVVLSKNVGGMVKPDFVLPFKINKEQAKAMLKQFYSGKILLPKAFTEGNRISKVTGMYVPFWLFSCKGEGTVSYQATTVSTWSSGDYNYTKTKYYDIFRTGSVAFEKIPVDASKKMEDAYMEGIEPYDYSQFEAFSPMYMAGYFADKFDVGVAESATRATKRIKKSVESVFMSTVTGYSSVTATNSNIAMIGDDIHYALLPVWMLNTKYEGKMYQFAINGQTGKVAGSLPIDKFKRNLCFALATIASFIPISLFVYWICVSGMG